MVKQHSVLVLAFVTWIGHGQRKQASAESAVGSLKVLARLFSEFDAAAAFNPPCQPRCCARGTTRAHGRVLNCGHHVGCRAAEPSMKIENKERTVGESKPSEQTSGASGKDKFKSCGSVDLKSVADMIKSGDVHNVIVMVGAGISVAAGIPDFRTPGTGLYDNLKEYGLPYPEAMFDKKYFLKKNSKPFYRLCGELWPGQYEPTLTHYFIRLLYDKGLLVRCYTQNIDSLESTAGLPERAQVAAHGNFDSASVYFQNKSGSAKVPIDEVKVAALTDGLEGWDELNAKYGGLVKPDIVFFGEKLPDRFFDLLDKDFPVCDLLLVLGTSLAVQPFASLVEQVQPQTPRLLINRQRVGDGGQPNLADGPAGKLNFTGDTSDGFVAGDCDDSVRKLVELLGWQEDLDRLVRQRGALSQFGKFMQWAANTFADIQYRKPRTKVLALESIDY